MNPVFKKLNYKQQPEILVLNAPASFNDTINDMAARTQVHISIPVNKKIEFALVFATTQTQLNQAASQLVPLLKPDAVLWFAYPKGSSKKYTCDFNRDTGWQVLGDMDFEGVRQIAIDEDWTALRFRKAQYIKSMTRNPRMAMSPDGKLRTENKGQSED